MWIAMNMQHFFQFFLPNDCLRDYITWRNPLFSKSTRFASTYDASRYVTAQSHLCNHSSITSMHIIMHSMKSTYRNLFFLHDMNQKMKTSRFELLQLKEADHTRRRTSTCTRMVVSHLPLDASIRTASAGFCCRRSMN